MDEPPGVRGQGPPPTRISRLPGSAWSRQCPAVAIRVGEISTPPHVNRSVGVPSPDEMVTIQGASDGFRTSCPPETANAGVADAAAIPSAASQVAVLRSKIHLHLVGRDARAEEPDQGSGASAAVPPLSSHEPAPLRWRHGVQTRPRSVGNRSSMGRKAHTTRGVWMSAGRMMRATIARPSSDRPAHGSGRRGRPTLLRRRPAARARSAAGRRARRAREEAVRPAAAGFQEVKAGQAGSTGRACGRHRGCR
ncbi:hypothetical protein QFZ66_004613 [Streptomyces sp. B4I13]|nr:hypothetical protein [Streptomyces sp. B4I13]